MTAAGSGQAAARHMALADAIAAIRPPDRAAMARTQKKLDTLLKPLDGLGLLERYLVKIAGMTGRDFFDLRKKTVVVFCADNGVVARGVSQTGKEVTAAVARNLTRGLASVCKMAAVAGADVLPVDIGIDSGECTEGLLCRKIARGTRDFTVGPAMTEREATAALEAGVEIALSLAADGCGMLGAGEMGIGNTTTAAALAAALLGLTPAQATGRGAGLADDGLARKLEAVRAGLALHGWAKEPFDLLARLGGLDIAGMAGLCLGGAVAGIPVALDGFISCVAALVAVRLAPDTIHYLLPSHCSAEPAAARALEALGLTPLLLANMRLGEGTGAVATFPLYDMMLRIYDEMPTFAWAEIEPYARV